MAHNPKRRCALPGCGVKFDIAGQWAKKYCCPDHVAKAGVTWRVEYRDRRRTTPAVRKCVICEGEFSPVKTQKYCGPTCAGKGLVAAIERQRQRRNLEKFNRSKL